MEQEFGAFILKTIIAVIVTNLILIVTMFRTKEFKYVKELAMKYINPLLTKVKLRKE